MRQSQAQRSELMMPCAVLSARAMHPTGFRQRDVKFPLDLFGNWLEYLPVGSLPEWQNTQIQRSLNALVTAASARRTLRAKTPIYRLTRTGLLSCLEGVIRGREYGCRIQFFFLFYFVKNYRSLIEQMIKSEGGLFPPALRIEVAKLCDLKTLVAQELREVDLLQSKLEARIELASVVSKFSVRARSRGEPLSEIIAEIEERFPFDLNSQRPLSEFVMQLPELQRRWQLEEGNLQRARGLWQPMQGLLEAHRQQVVSLAA